MKILAFTDGASRGNPGEGGIGIILKDDGGSTITRLCGYIGKSTNNVAEYTALIECLKAAASTPCTHLIVHSDSELLVRQLKGEYRVKDPTLKRYVQTVHTLLENAPFKFEIKYVPRELNREADQLANVGIDSKRKLHRIVT
jgi:ribonuclease HI